MAAPSKQAAGKATPAQIAMYGHVAAAFRKLFVQHKLTPSEFNRRVGLKAGHTGIYQYLNAKAAPKLTSALKISQAFGVPAADIVRKGVIAVPASNGALVPVSNGSGNGELLPPRPKAARVLSFSFDTDGMAHIDLSVTLPVVRAMAVMRLLEDAGLMRSGSGDET